MRPGMDRRKCAIAFRLLEMIGDDALAHDRALLIDEAWQVLESIAGVRSHEESQALAREAQSFDWDDAR